MPMEKLKTRDSPDKASGSKDSAEKKVTHPRKIAQRFRKR
jgi:hypothetical protein